MKKVLSIDPSGTGTTGLFFTDGKIWEVWDFCNNDWEKHLEFIIDLVREKQTQTVIFEHTNYVSLHGKDMTSLFKLFGGIRTLSYVFDFLEKVEYLPVNQVKELRGKVFHQTKWIKDLTYKAGRGGGWLYQNKKISLHQLDAFLLYYLWKEKKEDYFDNKELETEKNTAWQK